MEYLRMKYEQFLMRLFDLVYAWIMKSDNTSWYPGMITGVEKLDMMIDELQEENDHLKQEIREMREEEWL